MKNGVIEDDWRVIAITKLNELVSNAGVCLACAKVGTVGLGNDLTTPLVMNPQGGVQVGGATYPHVNLSCSNCGYTRFFNYVLLSGEEPELDLGATDE